MWSWLVSAVLSPLFNAIGNWLSGQQTRADEQILGQDKQAVADQQAQVAAATANEKQVADVVQAENASALKSAGDPSGLRDASLDSRD